LEQKEIRETNEKLASSSSNNENERSEKDNEREWNVPTKGNARLWHEIVMLLPPIRMQRLIRLSNPFRDENERL
jgi:hypothetical protein